ncbi:hypothetical protein PIB30_082589 [Stylosanthes scabra]|uniref:Uncharacterized protein n=1 Tax=Stylosanthes scabra TaxID=79078 RepID=A0ABU6URL8_9FABA|nr:hypothetical protein [Stylosanthes scabra]
MDRMDDQISFLCYSNQMANEQMLFPYQNTSRQFNEMEMQGIPVTMANLALHRQNEEEMNQERMRYDQILQRQQHNKQKKQTKAKLEKLCLIPKRSQSQVNPRNDKCCSRESERVNKR